MPNAQCSINRILTSLIPCKRARKMKPSSYAQSVAISSLAVKSIWIAMIFISAGLFVVVYVSPLVQTEWVSKQSLNFFCQATNSSHTDAAHAGLHRARPNLHLTLPPVLQQLWGDLKQSREIAESNQSPLASNADQEKASWNEENPCRTRWELPELYASRIVAADAPPNPYWETVLEEYSKLHRACVRKIGNVTDAFLSERSIPGCKFVTGESVNGLGNKITFAASLFLYAVLTKRVLLLPKEMTVDVMCEPFEGSSWLLPGDLEFLNHRLYDTRSSVSISSNGTDRFLSWVDSHHGNDTTSAASTQNVFYAEMDNGWHPVERFYCDTEQRFLSGVDWMSAAGCLYYLPKLYAIPSFRATLEALFPEPSLSLTYVLRSVFLPNDAAWERIQRVYAMHLETADRRVGVQQRFRGGSDEHTAIGSRINTRIIKCLQDNNLVPSPVDKGVQPTNFTTAPFPIVKVMITSLYADLYEEMMKTYVQQSTVTGESVGLVQISSDAYQSWGLDEDLQALVEMICLSLSDAMIVSPLSTFGGTSQAYGALRPWMVDGSYDEDVPQACERSLSVDMCYQMDPDDALRCPYDPTVDGVRPQDSISYLHRCSRLEFEQGLLLVPTAS